ncbi:MAG TPA: lytic transglycosylase domain-containing protein [Rhizomicrobium sp.]|nr:lytic transglycosylase domain-containing protein [Rhizomicrobium sp.]
MDLLSLFAGCSLFVSTPCHSASDAPKPVNQWQPIVSQAASQFALPDAWVNAVMAQESAGRLTLNGRPITSKAGAMGLMQVMPKTYADLKRQYGLGADAYAPADNILAGTAYLRQMYVRYGYPGMFAAYNAGPGRFDAYLAGKRPLPDETIAYLSAIAPGSETAFTHGTIAPAKSVVSGSRSGIFIAQDAPGALFVTLSTGHF